MVNAVLYVALNALDVLGCIAFTFILNLFVLHFCFPLFIISAIHGRVSIDKIIEFIQKKTTVFRSGKDKDVTVHHRRSAPVHL